MALGFDSGQVRFECFRDQIVPAAVRPALLALEACNVETVACARHGHVEQTIALFRFLVLHLFARVPKRLEPGRTLDGPNEGCSRIGAPAQAVEFEKPDAWAIAALRRASVGQEHDGRFQALRAMHGHDAHLVAALLHVALHFVSAVAQARQETGHGRGIAIVECKREFQELVHRVGRFDAEPVQEQRAAAVAFQQARIEFEGRREVGLGAPSLERFGGRFVARVAVRVRKDRLPERTLALRRHDKKIVICQVEERAFQHGRERQIILGQCEEIAERHQIAHRDLLGELYAVRTGNGNAAGLQGRHHRQREWIALAHEDEHVTRRDRPCPSTAEPRPP